MALNGLYCADVPLSNYSLTLAAAEAVLGTPVTKGTCMFVCLLLLTTTITVQCAQSHCS